jgi:hypothetical protein
VSGDVTYQALKRLTFLPDRDDSDNGNVIAGQEYYDVWFTGGNIYNATLTDVVINGTETARAERIITAPGDVTATVADYVIIIDKTVPEITTVTLPTDATASKSLIIKDGAGDAGAYNITIDGDGFDIDGEPSYVIEASYGSVEIIFDGTEWCILNAYKDEGDSGVIGPATSTDSAISLWDGTTGGVIKNSVVTVNGAGNLNTPGTLTASNFTGSSSGTNTGNQTTTGTSNRITVTNGTTNPVIDIAATYVGQNTITTLGTITTGTWNGTTIALARGGTGATDASGARTNLGLGTAATQNTGTSGTTLGFLDGNKTDSGNNTFSGTATFSNAAGVTTNTITERTAASGVTIDGVLLKDSGATITAGFNTGNETYNSYRATTTTITLYGSGTAGTPTYTVQNLRYTKNGARVDIEGRIVITAIGGIVGNVRIGGLPFTAVNDSNARGLIRCVWANSTGLVAGGVLTGTIQPNDTFMNLTIQSANSNALFTEANLTATFDIQFAGSYFTSA